MYTVHLVPGPAAKEASERIMKRLAYCAEHTMCIDMREEMHKVIYEVLTEHDLEDVDYKQTDWYKFIGKVSKQTPEKPDYWSSCGQCQHNSEEAEEIIDKLK